MADGGEEFYHRRIDRSPETQEFQRLPSDDRELISHLRHVMGSARNKVTKLRDELDERDRGITHESSRRKEAENKLDQLVEMYGDSSVTIELQKRLPRSSKRDYRKELEQEIDELKRKEHSKEDVDDVDDRGGSSRSKRSRSAEPEKRDAVRRDDYDVTDNDATHRRRRRGRSFSPEGDVGYGYDRSSRASSYPPVDTQQHYPGYYPHPAPAVYPYGMPAPVVYSPVLGNPVSQSSPVHAQGPGSGIQMVPQLILTPATPAAPSTTVPGTPGSAVSSSATSHPTNGANYYGASRIIPRSSANSPTDTKNQVLYTSTVHLTGPNDDAKVRGEQNRQIALLIRELDDARAQNRKLQEKLTATEKELETVKLTAQTSEAAIRTEHSQKIAELVDKIYKAQKERDEAMMGRLRVANQERDEALIKLQRKDRGQDELDHGAALSGGKVKNVLSELVGTDSATDIRQTGGLLVNTIEARHSRRRDITTEEMKAVLEDRDAAIAKAKRLEEELLLLQRQIRAKAPDKQQITTLQAKLLATQQERDMALSKVRKQEEELQNLRVYYSLHKSLSQEARLRDDFNNTLENIELQVKQRDSTIDMAQKENNKLLAQMKSLADDKASLAEQLQKAKASQKEAQNNSEKLERLVNVLRRKINGLGTKVDDTLE